MFFEPNALTESSDIIKLLVFSGGVIGLIMLSISFAKLADVIKTIFNKFRK